MVRVLLVAVLMLGSVTTWAGNGTCLPQLQQAVNVAGNLSTTISNTNDIVQEIIDNQYPETFVAVNSLISILNQSNQLVSEAVVEARRFNDQLPNLIQAIQSIDSQVGATTNTIANEVSTGHIAAIIAVAAAVTVVIGATFVWGGQWCFRRFCTNLPTDTLRIADPNNQ